LPPELICDEEEEDDPPEALFDWLTDPPSLVIDWLEPLQPATTSTVPTNATARSDLMRAPVRYSRGSTGQYLGFAGPPSGISVPTARPLNPLRGTQDSNLESRFGDRCLTDSPSLSRSHFILEPDSAS
jgi:hypothetical protein